MTPTDKTSPASEMVVMAWKYAGPRGGMICVKDKPSWPADPLFSLAQLEAVERDAWAARNENAKLRGQRDAALAKLKAAEASVAALTERVAWVGDYKKSDGSTDYYVMISCGGREMSLHMHSIRGRAEYEAAEINHILTGSAKPEFEDFDIDGAALSNEASHD